MDVDTNPTQGTFYFEILVFKGLSQRGGRHHDVASQRLVRIVHLSGHDMAVLTTMWQLASEKPYFPGFAPYLKELRG